MSPVALQFTPLTITLLAATLLSAVTALASWSQRRGPTETWGTLTQVTLLLWSGTSLAIVSTTTLETKLRWLLLFLPTIPLLSVSAMFFTIHFTGRSEWLTWPRRVALLSYPAVVLVLAVTNWYHGLLVARPALETASTWVFSGQSWTVLTYDWGLAFWLLPVVSYGLGVVYCWWLLEYVRHSRNVYRTLGAALFVMNVAVILVTIPSVLQVSPLPHFLLVPHVQLLLGGGLVLVTTSVKVARAVPVDRILGLFGSRFGDVVTLARDFVVEEVDNGILVLDDEDRVVDVNRTAKKMLGREKVVGKHLTELIHLETITDFGDLEPILTGSEPASELESEVWIRAADERRCYDVSISELADGDDAVGHVVMLHDITAQKRREQRLEKRERELEQQKRALEQRTEQLEHQNERLDRFASIVSHDLRNPLTVAGGYVDTLEEQLALLPDDAPVDPEIPAEIRQSHDRMEAIIEDALTLAREGKAITDTESVGLEGVARNAWENVDTEGGTIRVESDLTFEGDENRLLNVFENLFRNSIEHGSSDSSGSGDAGEGKGAPVTVTVTVGALSCGSGFYVEDDGPGFPPDRLEKVFDHGFTTSAEGTGLGLAIVSDVVRAHGWEIDASNATDGGARIEVTGLETASCHDDGIPSVGD